MATIVGFTDAYEDLILKHVFTTIGLTMPDATNLWVGLSSTTPSEETGTLNNITEPTFAVSGYARIAVPRATGWTVSATAPTQVVNAADIVFDVCAGSNYPANITYICIFDDTLANAGRCIAAASCTSTAVTVGQQIKILAGTLKLTLT